MAYFSLAGIDGSPKLHYELQGSGPLLVLLHNGFYSSASFRAVMHELQTEYCCVAWDRLGYGQSDQDPTARTSLASGADELDALLEHLRQAGQDTAKIKFWGHCMGGAIAVEWIARHPGRSASLMLEACGFRTDPEILRRTDLICRPWAKLPAALRHTMLEMHGSRRAPLVWSQIILHTESYVMSADYDLRPRLPLLDCPVLVANGDRDPYFSREHAREGASLMAQSELWLPDDCGHDMHLERGPETIVRFREFQNSLL